MREISVTRNFQGCTSRTLNFNFQDFPGPKCFPGLSRSWNFKEKIQDFPGPKCFPGLSRSWNFKEKNPGLSRRRGNPA